MNENEQIFEAATEGVEEVMNNKFIDFLKSKTFKKIGLGTGITLGTAGIIGGIAYGVRKYKNKIYDVMANILEKKGYVVLDSTVLVNDEDAENEIRRGIEN